MEKQKIGAIVVLYNPDLELLTPALYSLLSQVDEICLIDNTPLQNISQKFARISQIHYIALGENKGIAAAQNIGIKYFINKNFDFVIFSDQDSYTTEGVVNKLMDAYILLNNKGVSIAAIGTRAINKQTNTPYPSKSKELEKPREVPLGNITECYSIISSISLVPIAAFKLVGGFDEGLFIDGVDHEWCWRAWHTNKLRTFIANDAKITHMFGEGDKRLGTRTVAIASPFRVYYQYRNFIWLKRRDYTPKYWIKKNAVKYLIKLFYFPLMVQPRTSYLRNIIKGIRDGVVKVDEILWPYFNK